MGDFLSNALDVGLSEFEFWQMTIAEINRVIASRKRVKKAEARERALFDYILAQLITNSVNIGFTGKGDFPSFNDVYEPLLDDEVVKKQEQQKKQRQDELSAMRFKLFAQSFNKRFKEVAKDNNE